MSMEAAAKFLKLISKEESLKKQLGSADRQEVIDLARSRGCEMSMEEFRKVLDSANARQDQSEEELSDDNLEQVAGGVPPVFVVIGVALAAKGLYDMGVRREWW